MVVMKVIAAQLFFFVFCAARLPLNLRRNCSNISALHKLYGYYSEARLWQINLFADATVADWRKQQKKTVK